MPAVAIAGLPQRLGKYEIVLPLAAGGMARIYIARTTGIGMFERHVVLKLITPERANDAVAVQMFLDEARLAASLNHQNVGQVFEVGEDGGIHYLAMEYVHGQDMRALLAKAGSQGTRVPLELALTVVAGAAAGLNHAHERRAPDGTPLGIVHRDVSPSNIMIGYDGSVKLLDFGIAKAAARSVETQSGIIKGKFAYMAPEQCRGRDVDRRSDVFSLGIILYEITTQHRCFRADSDFDTMHRIVTGDVVRPTRIVQGYPQALEAIVMKALAVDPSTRYQSAGALLEAIESFAVSSRMSLSTMSLGRFMRDMFGDSPEPWLTNSGRADDVVEPKETTISNTNNAGSGAPPPQGKPRPPVVALPVARSGDDDLEDEDAAPTFLMGSDPNADDGTNGPNWNASTDLEPELAARHTKPTQPPVAKAAPAAKPPQRPTPTPSRASAPPASIQTASSSRASAAQASIPPGATPTLVGTGRPPAGQFPATPGSSSHSAARPAVGAVSGSQPVANTRHGYASGNGVTRGDSHPRSEGSAEASVEMAAPALAPNRRPLFIGLGLAAIGIAVLVVVTLGGSSHEDVTEHAPIIMEGSHDGSSAPEPPVEKTVESPSTGSAVGSGSGSAESNAGSAESKVVDPATSESTPDTPTPAPTKPAGTTSETPPPETPPPGTPTSEASTKPETTKSVATKPDAMPKPTTKPSTTTRPVATKPPVTTKPVVAKPKAGAAKPKAADCQPAGQYNGFDPRPVCK